MAATKIVILGAGGPGRDVLDIIRDINRKNDQDIYNLVGFLDNDPEKKGELIDGLEVLGPVPDAEKLDDEIQFVNTIGGPSYFYKLPDIIGESGLEDHRFETIIHPDAYISDSTVLGDGVVVYPQSAIYSNAKIGNHVMIKGARIGHDQPVGDYSRIEGGVCLDSNAEVGKCCYLGLNSTIRESVRDFAQVGMGSVVINEVESGEVVAGNPAEHIRYAVDSVDKYQGF
jgi:sugar O-acyltransferase (sialic acid O-acetyltransferase NeuD family)